MLKQIYFDHFENYIKMYILFFNKEFLIYKCDLENKDHIFTVRDTNRQNNPSQIHKKIEYGEMVHFFL